MISPSSSPAVDKVIVFSGLLSLMIGLYASARIYINMYVLEKYPSSGVLNTTSYPTYGQREEDCVFTNPYFSSEGQIRPASEAEVNIEADQQKRCIDSVQETRRAAKVEDMSQAAFFLFLGLGILISKKLFLR